MVGTFEQIMETETNFSDIMEILQSQKPFLAHSYGIESLGVFGSYVRREQSDLDLLVTFNETPGLLKFIELENYLSDLLGVKVSDKHKQSEKLLKLGDIAEIKLPNRFKRIFVDPMTGSPVY